MDRPADADVSDASPRCGRPLVAVPAPMRIDVERIIREPQPEPGGDQDVTTSSGNGAAVPRARKCHHRGLRGPGPAGRPDRLGPTARGRSQACLPARAGLRPRWPQAVLGPAPPHLPGPLPPGRAPGRGGRQPSHLGGWPASAARCWSWARSRQMARFPCWAWTSGAAPGQRIGYGEWWVGSRGVEPVPLVPSAGAFGHHPIARRKARAAPPIGGAVGALGRDRRRCDRDTPWGYIRQTLRSPETRC